MEIVDNGVMDTLGALDGFTGYVGTDVHINAYLTALHSHLSGLFDDQMDTIARAAPSTFWHVYESGKANIGNPGMRLWSHTLTGRGRNKVASINFKASKLPVPVDPLLTEPGKNGKSVREGLHVFVWKAPIVEYRLPVHIAPKRGKALVFAVDGEIVFTRNAVRAVPGSSNAGSFTAMLGGFYSGRAQAAVRDIDSKHLKGAEAPRGMLTKKALKKFNISGAEFKVGQQRARSMMAKKTGNYIGQAMARERISGDLWE